MAIDK